MLDIEKAATAQQLRDMNIHILLILQMQSHPKPFHLKIFWQILMSAVRALIKVLFMKTLSNSNAVV